MATIDKHGLMHGKLGNFIYFVRNGKQFKRCRPSHDHTTPSDRTAGKPNITEFSEVSKVARHLRTALAGEPGIQIHQVTHAQMVGLLIRVKNCDPGTPGSRTVASGLQTENGKAIFANHVFRWKRTSATCVYEALARNRHIEVLTTPYDKKGLHLIHLRINLHTGDFQRKIHPLPDSHLYDPFLIPQSFRRKKNHVQLLFIASNKTLQGVVIE